VLVKNEGGRWQGSDLEERSKRRKQPVEGPGRRWREGGVGGMGAGGGGGEKGEGGHWVIRRRLL